jgi:hypothetical protein
MHFLRGGPEPSRPFCCPLADESSLTDSILAAEIVGLGSQWSTPAERANITT